MIAGTGADDEVQGKIKDGDEADLDISDQEAPDMEEAKRNIRA